jgi:3-methyl-2-oxobutanoate hydroxymethyltransferase
MSRKPITLRHLQEMSQTGERIAMLTCYDATFSGLMNDAGVDCLLVGDSMGMVLQGHNSTLSVTLEQTVYHVSCVARGNSSAWLIADLPFGSYQEGPCQAMQSAAALMAAGAQMVKLEGGGWTAPTVRYLVERGVPVCAHLGLTPQSVHALGGWRVQGRDEAAAATLRQHARELADAGATMVVLELMPSSLAQQVTQESGLMTIGIGAGSDCHGQVLVMHDMLNLGIHRKPRFVRDFMQGAASVQQAVQNYVEAVKMRTFPNEALHGY